MGIQIIDNEKLLSKNQIKKMKQRISTYIQEHDESTLNTFLTTEILPNIHYEEETQKYNSISFQKENDQYQIHLSRKTPTDINELRKKLKDRMKSQYHMRKSSNDSESQQWKTYNMLKKHVNVKSVRIPNPDEIKDQQPLFSQLLETMPNSPLKTYITNCL